MAKAKRFPLREPRRFFRAAGKRLAEARFLVASDFTTAAVYLAGYAVECALKALLLSNEPSRRHQEALRSFRGVRAHDFLWLQQQLLRRKVVLPSEMADRLNDLAWWTTDLRYDPAEISRNDAREFLRATEAVVAWVKGRVQA